MYATPLALICATEVVICATEVVTKKAFISLVLCGILVLFSSSHPPLSSTLCPARVKLQHIQPAVLMYLSIKEYYV